MPASLIREAALRAASTKGGGRLRRPPPLCGFPYEACWRPRQGKARQTARQDQLSRAKAKQARQPSQISRLKSRPEADPVGSARRPKADLKRVKSWRPPGRQDLTRKEAEGRLIGGRRPTYNRPKARSPPSGPHILGAARAGLAPEPTYPNQEGDNEL